jgi:NADPH-dependent 2,4-dienoyl-CoA reductase/sulfur reductase-like enzyme
MKEFDMLIIGGGVAARNSVKMINQLNPKFKTGVIRDQKTTVNPCSIPYALGEELTIEEIVESDERITMWNADLIIDKAISIDPKDKVVHTESGDDYKYSKLLLYPGAAPVKPPIPGVDLDNVHVLRNTEDVNAVDQALKTAKKVVIVGGGYIGAELSVLIRNRNVEVTVIEMLPYCLMATLDPDFCEIIEDEMRSKDITILTNTKVTAIKGNGKVESVEIGDREIPADLVILGVGVRPETSLAEQTGINVGKTGIIVDNRMRTNIPDIYAAGDNIETYCYVTGKVKPGKIGSNAVVEAKVAVMNALGYDRIFPGIIGPSGTKIFDLCFGMVGVGKGQAERDGLEVIVGNSETTSMYNMIPGTIKTRIRLYFKKQDHTVVGGQIVGGQFIAGHIDFIAQAIRNHLTIEDLATIHYTTHPELTPDPATHGIMLAAEDALLKTKNSI